MRRSRCRAARRSRRAGGRRSSRRPWAPCKCSLRRSGHDDVGVVPVGHRCQDFGVFDAGLEQGASVVTHADHSLGRTAFEALNARVVRSMTVTVYPSAVRRWAIPAPTRPHPTMMAWSGLDVGIGHVLTSGTVVCVVGWILAESPRLVVGDLHGDQGDRRVRALTQLRAQHHGALVVQRLVPPVLDDELGDDDGDDVVGRSASSSSMTRGSGFVELAIRENTVRNSTGSRIDPRASTTRCSSSASATTLIATSRSGRSRSCVGDGVEHALVHRADEHDDGVHDVGATASPARHLRADVDVSVVPLDRAEPQHDAAG